MRCLVIKDLVSVAKLSCTGVARNYILLSMGKDHKIPCFQDARGTYILGPSAHNQDGSYLA